MRSVLFQGYVRHTRFSPVEHRLQYPLYLFAIDLEELEALDHSLRLFGHNRIRPFSIYDGDYLTGGGGPIRAKLLDVLEREGIEGNPARIILVTSPRHLSRVFNPVSFYYCFTPEEELLCTVAEVNNTFGERHVYVPRRDPGDPPGFPARFIAPKAFHVSPFNDLEGIYHFSFGDLSRELDIRIELRRGEALAFSAELWGKMRPLNDRNLFGTLLRHPLMARMTLARIYREAAKLYFLKKLPYHPKPVPMSAMTIGRPRPSAWQGLCRKLVLERLGRIDRGTVRISLPEGKRIAFGDPASEPKADWAIHDPRFFSRTALGGDIGLGESYVDGEWDSPDVARLFEVLIANRDRLADGSFWSAAFARARDRIRHLLRENTISRSPRNIRDHYDLGNAFYETFLDASMTYSCALFRSPGETLEEAQRNKLRAMIARARIGPEDHVLEIGCGWGGFSVEAVRETGCRVTGITLSPAQLAWAQERVRREGLAERIDLRLSDYRHVEGAFDRIVSIEMLEAVGHRYLPLFFRRCAELLKPEGRIALQTITIPDERYDDYRKGMDWIRKHIFPGGHLPSPGAIVRAAAKAGLVVVEREEIGPHYAPTLREWRNRFLSRLPEIERMGLGQAFQRKWIYYLASCEAGFAAGATGDLQLVLCREPRR